MLTKKQMDIFEPITKNIFKEYTIKEIKKESKEKSNNALAIAIKKFKELKLVREKAVGRTLLYSVNIDNDLVFSYISLINSKKLPEPAKKAIKQIKEEIEKHTLFYSLAVFGSYAIGEQKRNSDFDIAVFIEKENERKKIQAALSSAELKSILKIHGNIITRDEFLEMLKVDYENLGKQIARKHLIIHNPSIFYSLLKEGVENGFRL